MVESVGHYAEGESLDFRDCFLARGAVGHGARQLNHLGNPAAVGFLFDLNPRECSVPSVISARV